jgi:hypothetical protein
MPNLKNDKTKKTAISKVSKPFGKKKFANQEVEQKNVEQNIKTQNTQNPILELFGIMSDREAKEFNDSIYES